MTLKEELFDLLHEDLVHSRPEYEGRDVILCPICLREIKKGDVVKNGVEHIIPRNVVKQDPRKKSQLGSLNQRCGITVLCRQSRMCLSDEKISSDGCNGLKGKLYDRLWKPHWGDDAISRQALSHRHGVSILIMAYLGAFQVYGYEYIFQEELDEIRSQFDYPDVRKTTWLDKAQVHTRFDGDKVVATASGHPFVTGGITATGHPLNIFFRRFRAELPSGHWTVKTSVGALISLSPKV